MQFRAPEAPREALHLRHSPLESGAPMFVDSEPLRGLLGPLGELGPRPSREDLGAKSLILQMGLPIG
eukprot:2539327-Alexandrium_andersonii.AAC.1